MRRMARLAAVAAGAGFLLPALALPGPARAGPRDLVLAPPVACEIGKTCFIQNYPDRDPGPGAGDFTCGPLSYDGHKGTDFALPDLAAMEAGVDVRAAAPGVVRGVRDGMPDIAPGSPGAPDIAGRECGNGVSIDHGGGWVTQYCHMRRGSVAVIRGQRVATGTRLGSVGMSGKAAFPHLHFALRHEGRIIDPFLPRSEPTCAGTPAPGLWKPPLSYQAGGILGAGFAPGPVAYEAVLAGSAPRRATLPADAPALVLWVHLFGLRKGDLIVFAISGPGGLSFAGRTPVEADTARMMRFFGKRLGDRGRWPAGEYRGRASLMRNGEEIGAVQIPLRIMP